jgi:ankyrin repeat protein
MNQVMNFVAQSPEGQRVLGSLVGSAPPGPGMASGVGMPAGMGGPVPGFGAPEAPVFQAARQGEVAVVEQLLGSTRGTELSAQLSQAGDTLLHVACWEGKARLVRMLLARGHDVHALSRNKSTPLHYSSWNGHSESAKILLESQADTERHMQGGDTALHQAAWNGHTEVARLLLDNGASMSATKEDGVCEHWL